VVAALRDNMRPADWAGNVLDLAAGSGEVSLVVAALGGRVIAVEPYCHEAYLQRVGQPCLRQTFEQICLGELSFEEGHFSMYILWFL
jgi:predicted RNA methylase